MAGFKEYQMLFQLNASVGGSFNSAFSTGASSVSQLQEKINSLNRTSADISSYQKQQSAIDKTKAKIELYQTQLQNLQNATATTSKEEAELANAIAAKEKQLNDSNDKLAQQNAALSETGEALRAAGVDTANLASESERLKAEAAEVAQAQKEEAEAAQDAGNKLRDAMEGAKAALETAGIIAGLKAVYSALSDCSRAAAEFETSMAGVKRTVGGSDQFISELGDNFQRLSTEIPITATELANIATTAGQLGIAQDNVEVFSTVMAQLATTTDLTADNAATMLAQFSNITGVTDYERLGSAVAALGDSTATTASKVVDMSQGMAAAASLAGMSSTDILAISAAVGSLGIEAAAGSTSMSQLITKLYKATETGDQLTEIAAVAGMTGDQFKQAWGQDAVGAMNSFIQGLNNVEQNGASAVVVLDQLGINNVRQTKAILGLASAGDLLSNTISVANNAWNQNTALTEKAGVMYNTTEAKLTMMGNAANNVKIAVGDALNPALGAVSEAVTGLLQPISEWLSANPAIVQGITAFIGALGLATAGIVAYTAVTKLAAAASALFAGAIPGLGVILGVAGAIGVAVAAISALTGGNKEAAKSFEEMNSEYDAMMDQFTENSKVLDLVEDYKDLSSQTENLQKLMKGGFSTNLSISSSSGKLTADDFIDSTTISLTPEVAKELSQTDFLKDSKVKLTPEQADYLYANDFMQGNLTVELTPEQAKQLTSASFLKSTKVQLTPEQKKYLKSDEFIDGKKVIELTPEQASKLAAAGFLEGTTVQLTAEQANALAAEGFMDGTQVQLTATAAKRLQVSEFMAEQTVTITGEAGNVLTAADFGVSDQTLTYIATMDPSSYQDVQTKASALQEQIISTGSKLNSAKMALSTALRQASFLEEKIAGTKKKSDKTALQQQLEDLNKSITEQQTNVDNLQIKYDTLNSEYRIVGTAAQELSGKEAELLAIKQQLSGVAIDVAEASGEQAQAYNDEAEAAERVAKSRQDDLRNQMYASIIEQSGAYIASLQQEEQAAANLNTTREKQARIQSQITDNTKGNGEAIRAQWEEVNRLYNEWAVVGGMMDEMPPALAEGGSALQDMVQAATGFRPTLESIIGAGDTWIDQIEDGSGELRQAFTDAESAAQGYQSEIDSANQTQADFVDNLVNGVQNGVMEIDELRDSLTETFADQENGAETVDQIMQQVEAQLNAAAAAAEDYANGTAEVGSVTEEAGRSVEEITADIEALGKAWDEAYDSAYTSMSGQFKLFESAEEKIKKMHEGWDGGTKGMKSGIDSQTQYVTEYAKNFDAAKQKLEASGASAETVKTILSSLADGSEESAAALKSIADGTKKDAGELAKSYEALQTAKANFSADVAEMKTDFSTQMNSLTTELASTVAKMDKSSEAATAARNTLNSYVNAANGYASIAASKWGAVARAAVQAMNKELANLKKPEYASGTQNAAPGVALVGEEGPELVVFKGGEKVLNANETRALANKKPIEAEATGRNSAGSGNGGGSNYTVTLSPQYSIGNGTNANELSALFAKNTDNLRTMLESMLKDIKDNEQRRAFA